MQHLAYLRVRDLSLGAEVVHLVDDQMPIALGAEIHRREVEEEPRTLGDHPAAQVDQHWDAGFGRDLGHRGAGVGRDRHLGMLTPEDGNRQTSVFAVG